MFIAILGLFWIAVAAACAGSSEMNSSTMRSPTSDSNKMDHMGTMDKMMPSKAMVKTTDDAMMAKNETDETAEPWSAMLTGSEGHHASGKVSFADEMGAHRLMLSDVTIDKVPDGHVYLAKNGDRTQGIDLGILRKFSGRVSFALPAGISPDAYDSVIIYCEQYDVEIGRALFKKMM